MPTIVTMPKWGLTMTSGTITGWSHQEGDTVTEGGATCGEVDNCLDSGGLASNCSRDARPMEACAEPGETNGGKREQNMVVQK